MNSTRILLMAIALLLPVVADAQKGSRARMVNYAKQALTEKLGIEDQRLSGLDVVDERGQIAIVSAASGGTAFVGKKSGRVMGCAPSAYAKGDVLPCGLEMWLVAANNALSNEVISRAISDDEAVAPTDVASFVATQWNQYEPYNGYCPKVGGETSLTGCVATAMAQVMYHYKYPAQGMGTGYYIVEPDTVMVDINGVYDWNSMKTEYSLQDVGTTEGDAVAMLIRDCGYSVGMQYGTGGSSASDASIPSALAYNFAYDSLAVNWVARNYTPDTEWKSIIYSELAAEQPVIFSGRTSRYEGHCFILDGMSADGNVHVNWGWGGLYDGFYDMDVFDGNNEYVYDQSIVYGFTPEPTPENVSPTYRSCIIAQEPKAVAEGTLIALFGVKFYNYDWREFEGDVQLEIVNTDDPDKSYSISLFSESDVLLFLQGRGYDINTINRYLGRSFVFPSGNYKMSLTYQSITDDEKKTARISGGKEWWQAFSVNADGVITLNESSGIATPTIDEDTTTNDAPAYDIYGKLVDASHKGLTIVNGKKVIRK